MGAQHVATKGLTLEPYPFPYPILEGSPEGHGQVVVLSDDKKIGGGVWTCTAGTFEWNYEIDEIVYILEGGAAVENRDTGEKCELVQGDMAMFPAGTKTTWRVADFVKKVFVVRGEDPLA